MPSSIYTRGGDTGRTSLADGRRIPKDHIRVEAYGAVDEANSWIGEVRSHIEDPLLSSILTFLQHRFYNCSSNLARPSGDGAPTISEDDVTFLERAIDRLDEIAGPIRTFVVPGGTSAASSLHIARTVTRRAERRIVSLNEQETVDPGVLAFINRSSDLLFAAARYANRIAQVPDVPWKPDLAPPILPPETT